MCGLLNKPESVFFFVSIKLFLIQIQIHQVKQRKTILYSSMMNLHQTSTIKVYSKNPTQQQ